MEKIRNLLAKYIKKESENWKTKNVKTGILWKYLKFIFKIPLWPQDQTMETAFSPPHTSLCL